MKAAEGAIAADERFEHLVPAEDPIREFAKDCVTDRKTNHVSVFMRRYGQEVTERVCYFGVEFLSVKKPAEVAGIRFQHGADQAQQETAAIEASARTILYYDHAVISGLLQVRDYARRVFELADVGTADIPGKVDGRMRRQSVLLDQSKQFTILMTEAALRWRPGSAELQVQQLGQIAAVMRLPNVSIGILPLHGQARVLYPEGFQVYADRDNDADTLVLVELVPDELTLSETDDVALYLREFDRLRSAALFDDQARTLLDRIAEDIDREGP
jgi:hypothetical protein